MVQYLIHMDPLSVPLAVPLSVPVCFLPPHPLLHAPHPLEFPSLCQSPHFHHMPSLQPPLTTLALPLPAPQLSQYFDLFLSLFCLLGQKKDAMSLPRFMITIRRRNLGACITFRFLTIPPYKSIGYRNATAKTDEVTWLTSQHCVDLARIRTRAATNDYFNNRLI